MHKTAHFDKLNTPLDSVSMLSTWSNSTVINYG